MIELKNKHRFIITLTIAFLFVLVGKNDCHAFDREIKKSLFQDKSVQDSISNLELRYNNSIAKNDTINAIRNLNKMARFYGHQGNHKEAYDKLWEALLLADKARNNSVKSYIYKEIGRHYSYYHRRDKALRYLSLSLALKKEMIKNGEIGDDKLVDNYLGFVATHRELGEFDLAKKYLDSCYINKDENSPRPRTKFMDFEEAVILINKGREIEAIEILNKILPWFVERKFGYQVIINKYLGDSYQIKGDFEKSVLCYNKAIQKSEETNLHKDFVPLIYEGLAKLYFSNGKFLLAYESVKKAKDLDAIYFDSRSVNNLPLLEIQDDFRKEKEEQVKLIQEQKLKEFEQEEKVLFLEKLLLWGFIVFLILFGIISLRAIRTKHKVEKSILRKKRELEKQKDVEVIELKNKELAASVLKLIEKDVFIEQIKDKLSKNNGEIKPQDAKKIINSISNRNSENWEEFQARFVSINKSFYENLEKQFPKLTINDQKLCALIKLNFSSKDIARLLNMSIESVHTTRSRLRKKLHITRDVNLKQFISSI
jgi:tetratricopeptide (TPR) repeat protein